MSGKLYTGGINLSKVDKSKLNKDDKGNVWLNVALWVNEDPDDYGNHASIQQSTTKEEEKIYLGNLKKYQREQEVAEDTDLPF